MHHLSTLANLPADFRHAFRTMRSNPGFTAVAVASLALGIGANTAVFSVVNAVMLRPLPYPDPGRLVRVAEQYNRNAISIPEYEFWKEHSRSFASMAGYRGGGDRGMPNGAGREWLKTTVVTADFFRTLGVVPSLGREFSTEELRSGGPQAVILSDAIWRRDFGADPGVLGRAVRLDEATCTVVGVLPASFWFHSEADAYLPLRVTGGLDDRGTNTDAIARLKPGVPLAHAQAEAAGLTAAYRRAYPEVSAQYRGLVLVPFQEYLSGDVRTNLLLLFGAVALLLLIACSNLAGLLLARLAGRSREIAVRLALGAGAARLLRQFLVENLLLAFLGGAAGLIGAWWLLRALLGAIPFPLTIAAPVRIDTGVLAFTLAAAFATGLLFTLPPVLNARRLDIHTVLKSAGRVSGAGPVRQRTRAYLVVGEVALSTALLVSAGLLIQSLFRLNQERLGFRPHGLVTFSTPLEAAQHRDADALAMFQNALLEHLGSLPGVRGVAATNVLPLDRWSNLPTQREGHPEQSIGGMEVRVVTPSYFEVMGIPVVRGRSFTENDTASGPPAVLVNETLARRWWPDSSPVGDRLVIGTFKGKRLFAEAAREVIGVVADTKTAFLKEEPWPTVFVAARQAGVLAETVSSPVWIVRTGAPAGLASGIRRTVAQLDPRQRILKLRTMDDVVAATTADSRFDAWLFGAFAALALVLAGIGVYGLLAFSVAQRRQEIGTRLALGAGRGDVQRMVLRQGLALTAAGLAIGLAAAAVLARSIASLLFGVKPYDPLSYAAVAAVLLAVGLLASYLPARRATRVDPMVALRYE